ncbi:nitrogenase component 1 [uncultured Eubacterium sp.]|uniref:nitrogenase component 1 n=1 Tax=uncultured Eubacterium sp. TaxID=165185 RepID=UPI0025FAC393|nr:nitrogenase component 1 [uncultured Eubacterium sp.]MCI6538426.1 nitrogenase component 1 [Lachnospiraceae bacterium]
MRQSYRIIPIYTADVSGVCSALYELGGMTVMHDPSGCNSTYNTHDEIRWYDQDSLIFISGLTEIDAIMGNDRKFIDDIEHAARELHPKFIALAGSPIPFMNGTDFPAIARVIETETGIPTFSVPTNGMHDYVYGAGIALEEIAKRFTEKTRNLNPQKTENRSGRSVNLLGITPLDFGPQKNVEILKENLRNYGWNILSAWAMGDTLETLQQAAGTADVNLVVSAVGLRTAKVLQEKYGTPYVIGTPNEWLTEDISEALEKAAEQQAEQLSDVRLYLQNRMQKEAEITLIGEPVTMGSLAAGIEKKYGRSARVFCPLKECENLIGEKDAIVLGEEAMEEALKDAKIIVADPLYRPICPKSCEFYELPHIAFSGRIFLSRMS